MSEAGFRVERDGAVAVLTFDQPGKRNALAVPQLVALAQACRDLGEDRAVRAVVVTGEAPAFCAGADLTADVARDPARPRAVRFRDTRLDFVTPLVTCPKPTIAAVNGIAVGAGLGIALACDLRLCGESGVLLPNFTALGLSATDGVPWLLSRLVGAGRAFEILYADERIDAAAALALGLVNRVVEDGALRSEALALASKIAAKPPVAMQMTKAAMLGSHGRTLAEALTEQELAYASTVLFGGRDTAAAFAARSEKRPGRFVEWVPFAPEW